jgi:peptidoglycan/LPS O-acetylase OafA/YrhL
MPHLQDTQLGEAEKALPRSSPLGALTRYRSILRRIMRILAPSFLSHSPSAPQDRERPTDFLDGMRGYAAFIVYCDHFILPTHPLANTSYSGNDGVADYWPTQLPIIRLIYGGRVSVSLFFTISGFSISLKPLEQARSRSYSLFLDTMASATFRRTFRLFLPCLVMPWITFIIACLGAFDFSYALMKDWPFLGKPNRLPIAHHNVWLQFNDWLGYVYLLSDPLDQRKRCIPYGTQLWTIPVELRSSFISFLTLVGLAKVRPVMRMGITTALGAYFQFKRHPEVTLFLAGNTLAELYLIRQERATSNLSQQLETQRQKIQSCVLFVISLFIASYPLHYAEKGRFSASLYHVAKFFFGEKLIIFDFYVTLSSVMLIYVVSCSPFLQGVFLTRVGKYLGKISFALYCVHQALINWFGYRSILFFWTLTGNKTTGRYEFGLVLSWIFQTIATIWAADMFWRFIDLPTVRIAKRLEEMCFVQS